MTTTMSSPPVAAARATGELELTDITKSYNVRSEQRPAVDDFSLSVEPGEFITLLGPSGCGKTTTLRMIAGRRSLIPARSSFRVQTSPTCLRNGAASAWSFKTTPSSLT